MGPRIVRLGTGRVMSQTRIQALLRPRAISRKGSVPMGVSIAPATAFSGSPRGVTSPMVRGPTTRPAGNSTGRPVRP